MHWVYFFCLLTGYRKSDLTIVYPLARGSGPLLSSSVAVIVFGERLSAFGVLGIAGVVVGVFLVAGGPALFKAAHDPAKKERVKAGVFWGLLTGAMIACYTVLDAYAVKVIALSPILFDYWSNILRLPYAVAPVLRDIPEAKRLWKLQWKYAAIIAIFSPDRLCVRALRGADSPGKPRRTRARGEHAVCCADWRAFARRGRPCAAHHRCSGHCGGCHRVGVGLIFNRLCKSLDVIFPAVPANENLSCLQWAVASKVGYSSHT